MTASQLQFVKTFRPPADYSLAQLHRALMIATVCGGTLYLTAPPEHA